ncbi:MAG: phage holin family protein, partial [Streptomycetaceae bacterium]|nr:phage holin family protein [Streptomycetaceae bacterium]
WVSDKFDLSFHVDGFWPALLGALVVSLVSWFLNLILDRD